MKASGYCVIIISSELLGNIKRYDKRPAMFLGRPGGDNKDVVRF